MHSPRVSRRRSFGLLFVCASLAACGAPGADGTIPTLTGTVVLQDGTTPDGRAAAPGVIQDVVRDGNRVAVMIFTAVPTLMISDDLGLTWVRHELPTPASQGILSPVQNQMNPMTLHLYQGHVFVLIATQDARGAGFYPSHVISEVDLAANTYARIGTLDGGRAFAFGATEATYGLSFDPRNNSFYNATFNQFDFSTRTNVNTNPSASPAVRPCTGEYISGDGLTFESYCQSCRAHGVPSAGSLPVNTCVGSGAFVPSGSDPQMYPTSRGVMAFFGAHGRGWATAISDATPPIVTYPIDLGPGMVPDSGAATLESAFGPGTNHTRYGDTIPLVPLTAAGRADPMAPLRFVEIPTTGDAVERPLPPTPCADPMNCGFPRGQRTLSWSVHLDGDSFLDFYTVNAVEHGTRVSILVRRDTVPTRPIADPTVFAMDGPFAAIENEVTGTALDQMCARVATCFPGVGDPMLQCLAHWSTPGSLEGSTDPALLRFLATPPGCASFVATFPQVALSGPMTGCTRSCQGDAAIVTCAPTGTAVIDCAALGTSCVMRTDGTAGCGVATVSQCNTCDASGNAITCAGGLPPMVSACAARGYQCALDSTSTPTCTHGMCLAGQTVLCESGVSINCRTAGLSGVGYRTDCTRLGLDCLAGTGCVARHASPTCAGDPGLHFGTRCQDHYLVLCEQGEYRYLDCAALGFTGCVETGAAPAISARCMP